MAGKRVLFTLSLVFWLVSWGAFPQITVSFPVERMVYQRANDNTGVMHIAGTYAAEYDSILARAEVRPGFTGISTAWIKIAERDDNPYFKGTLTATGGWYTLTVQAWKNGSIAGSQSIQRVGIGEVFVTVGQSNAAGTMAGYGFNASDDRANVINFSSRDNNPNALPIGFSQMADPPSGFTSLGPSQYAVWHWGLFADMLIQQTGVPVLIYGAAYAGTEIRWWYESAYGLPLTNPASNPHIDPNPAKNQPYGGLKSVLQYYVSLTGLRGVLWHQGEGDSYIGTTAQQYKNYLQNIITKTRVDVGDSSLSWMVARASVIWNTPYAVIRQGQNETIAADPLVFAGPDTDAFLGGEYRKDGTHLDTDPGLFSHAAAWRDALLSTGFLSQSTPLPAEEFIDLTFGCMPDSQIQLNAGGNFQKYAWSITDNTDVQATGHTEDDYQSYTMLPPAGYYRRNWQYDSTATLTAGAGTYLINALKSSGKRVFSPFVSVLSAEKPAAPSIAGPSLILQGQSATLTGSGCAPAYRWSTGSSLPQIEVSPAATTTYSLVCKGLYCFSAESTHQLNVSDCYPNPLSLQGVVSPPSALYRTQQTLSSSQTVGTGISAVYNAYQSITLQSGFSVAAGGVFKAEIKNCP